MRARDPARHPLPRDDSGRFVGRQSLAQRRRADSGDHRDRDLYDGHRQPYPPESRGGVLEDRYRSHRDAHPRHSRGSSRRRDDEGDDYEKHAELRETLRELQASLEDLEYNRDELERQIIKGEEDRRSMQNELRLVCDRVQMLQYRLASNRQMQDEYDMSIQEGETAYMKILASSQGLLDVLKRENCHLGQRLSEPIPGCCA